MYDANDTTFQQIVLEAEGPVLVDLWAEWCGPCKIMAPLIKQLEHDLGGTVRIARVNIDTSPNTFRHYDVNTIPTLMVFENGTPICKKVGMLSKNTLNQWLSHCVKSIKSRLSHLAPPSKHPNV